MFKINVSNGIGLIQPEFKKCSYGSKSYPSAKALMDYAQAHPEVKFFGFDGIKDYALGTWEAGCAKGTMGAWITKGNKAVNGVDPAQRDSNGAGKVSYSLSLSADKISLKIESTAGESVTMRKGLDGFSYRGKSWDKKLGELAMRIQSEAREGDLSTIESMVSVEYTASITEPEPFTIKLESDDYAKASGAMVTALIQAGKGNLCAEALVDGNLRVDTLGLADYAQWAGVNLD